MSQKNWYLIHSKPKQETQAVLHLQRQNFHCYLPMLYVKKRRKQQYNYQREVMFPRYLFIELDTTHDNWAPIRSTCGVHQLVRFGMQPAKLPHDLVELLREQEMLSAAAYAAGEQVLPSFQAGQKVLVADGAFAGYEAIFQQASGHARALILLEIAGKQSQLRIDMHSLQDSAA